MAIALVVHAAQGSPDTNGFVMSTLDDRSTAIDTTGVNLLVVVLMDSDGTSVITDNKGNSPYATAVGQLGGFASNFNTIFYFKSPSVGTGHTFTVTGTAKSPSIAMAGFSGVDTTSPLDQHTSASSNFGSSAQPGSITPGSANQLVVSGVTYQDTGNTLSIDLSFIIADQLVQQNSAHLGGGLAYIIQTTATAVNPTWSEAVGNIVSVTIASFKAGSSGVTGTAALTAAAAVSLSAGSFQTAYPILDISDGAWTTEIGGTSNLYISVGEQNAIDATFIQSELSPNSSQVKVRLGPQPSAPINGTITLKVRHANNTGTGSMNYTYDLMQSTTVIQTFGPYAVTSVTVAEVDVAVTNAITDWVTPFDIRITATQTA